jgi:hypothetical protein
MLYGGMIVKKLVVLLVCLCGSLFLVGCDNPISQVVAKVAPKPVDGYLAVQSDNIAWVKLVISDAGQVSGQWIANDIASSGAGEQIVFPLTGTYAKQSNAISMILQGPLGVSINVTGTLKDDTLTLQMQQNGATKQKVLKGASEQEYQTALSAFQAKHPFATPTPAA